MEKGSPIEEVRTALEGVKDIQVREMSGVTQVTLPANEDIARQIVHLLSASGLIVRTFILKSHDGKMRLQSNDDGSVSQQDYNQKNDITKVITHPLPSVESSAKAG